MCFLSKSKEVIGSLKQVRRESCLGLKIHLRSRKENLREFAAILCLVAGLTLSLAVCDIVLVALLRMNP